MEPFQSAWLAALATVATISLAHAQAPAESAAPAASSAEAGTVDINAIRVGETYRWGGNYLENKGGCRFMIGGRSWGPRTSFAPTPPGEHRINSRQNYHTECAAGGPIKLILIDK